MSFVGGAWSRILSDLQIAEWQESPARAVIHAFRPPVPAAELAEEILGRHLYRLHHHPGVQLPEILTWDEDPLNDRNWQMWHHSLLHVSYLTQAFEATKHAPFLARAESIVESWISTFIYGGREHPMAWHDHAIAQRTLVLLEFAEALRLHRRGDIVFARRLLAALHHHGSVLTEPHIYRLRHNHGIEQDRALLELAILVPQWPESEAWRQLAWSRLLEQVRAAISLEGVYFEHSPNYEGIVCLMLGQTRDFLAQHGRPHEEISHAIENLGEKIAFSLRPDGSWPPVGDSMAHRSEELLEQFRMNPRDSEHALYALTAGAEGTAPSSNHLILPSDGCAVIRERWDREGIRDSLHCYFTAAFNTRTHKHHDDLSFTVFGFGREILTDAGRHSYNYTNPHRRYCESVHGHNVVMVDRADTDTRRLNVGKSGITAAFTGKNLTGVDAVHYLYPGVESRRLLVYFPPNVIVVFDRLLCDRAVTATQQFLFAPDWRVEAAGACTSTLRATLADGASQSPTVFMTQLMSNAGPPRVVCGQTDPLVGWVSRRHGSFEPAPAVHTDATGEALTFVTAFAFHGCGREAVQPVGSAEWSGSSLHCSLNVGSQSYDFTFDADPVRSQIRFRETAVESSVWPTPFEYRSRRSLARTSITEGSGISAEPAAEAMNSRRVVERLGSIAAQVEQVEAGQRQTVESLHRQIHQLHSSLRTIQNKLNGASMRRIEQLERSNEVLDLQVRQLSRRIAKSEKVKRVLREKAERSAQSLLTLREGGKARQGELSQLRSSVRKLQKMQNELREKLLRAGEKQKVERERYLHSQAQLWDTMNSVRWRLGDAFVTALHPSMDTLKLPYRLIKLLFDGIYRRSQRKLAEQNPQQKLPAATAGRKAAPVFERKTSDLVQNARALAPQPRRDVRVACVLDEFSYECFESEGDWRQLLPETWERQMDEQKPELLFVESAWKGKDEKWRHLVSTDRRIGDGPVKALVDYCRTRNIPTVFWNKEDPANYEHFIESAVWFDQILTTDSDCIDRYSKAAGHNRVGVLPFAAQPRIHNPIGRCGGDLGNVCFAGTWYAAKHDGRAEDARLVLEPALPFGLHIYDRMFGYSGPGWQNYLYPPEYQEAIRGGLPYEEMLDAYKRYHIFLNVNSVRTSPTMCSRRVFEILACGTNVVSAYAPAIENLLGSDCVFLTRSIEETRLHLEGLLGSETTRNRTSVRAIRKVMAEHTCAHRFAEVLAKLGMGGRIEPTTVGCILPVGSRNDMTAALRFLADVSKLGVTPIWVVADDSVAVEGPGRVIRTNGSGAASAFAAAMGEVAGDYVFVWSAKCARSAEILKDLVNAFAYYGGDAVYKPTSGAHDRLIFAEATDVSLGTTLLRTSAARRFDAGCLVNEAAFSAAVQGAGLRCFATDSVGIEESAGAQPASGVICISTPDASDGTDSDPHAEPKLNETNGGGFEQPDMILESPFPVVSAKVTSHQAPLFSKKPDTLAAGS